MSVPLDRLYHYLADCVNHDLLIYRWFPHGSRKLEDLDQLTHYPEENWYNDPLVVFHDQEPLMYDFYTQEQFRNHAVEKFSHDKFGFMLKPSVLDYVASQHLRGVMICTNQYDKTILVHSELRSDQVELFAQNNFVPVYFWSHAVIALDWFRYAEHDPKLQFSVDTIAKDFLIYNRAWGGSREYRLAFATQLVSKNLVDHCETTFCAVDQNKHYNEHRFTNQKFAIQNTKLENYFAANTHLPQSSADYMAEDYARCGIEIVLETLFDDHRWHITEKTLRAIAVGKPFILMATPGSLEYLRSYGFETFDGLINESYDLISDSVERLQAVIEEMQRIAALDNDSKLELYSKLQHIAQRNRHRFFNGLWGQVMDEYQTNMNQAIKIMQQNCNDAHRTAIRQLLQT